MRRREFIAGLGMIGSTAVIGKPDVARTQQRERMARVGVLMATDAYDRGENDRLSAFKKTLAELGWAEGRNLQLDIRWAAADVGRMRALAKELVDLSPDLVLTYTTPVTAALRSETRTIPIVFVNVGDPIGAGFVSTLSRPGGNITGFSNLESSIGGKWLELLKEVAPSVKRATIIFNPDTGSQLEQHFRPSFEAAARTLKITPSTSPVRSDEDIEKVISAVGHENGGGLVVIGDGGFNVVHRRAIISHAERNNVPAVYFSDVFTRDGGLLSYGVDNIDMFFRTAAYVDRILRGTKPADLPVQLPVKFVMVVNVKTAKALGLTVPPSVLLGADEVIE